MALVNAYCAVADVRSQMDDSAGKLSEAMIERAISAASRAIDKHCDRRFWRDPAPVTRVYTASGPCILDVADIAARDGLLVETDPGGSGAWAALAPSDFHLEPLDAEYDGPAFSWTAIAADRGARFPVSRTPLVRVTATWGWSEIPDDVTQACLLKSVSLFARKDAPMGIAGMSEFGPVRISRTDPDVVSLLRPFVRTAVA
jgi:hypothetical protein